MKIALQKGKVLLQTQFLKVTLFMEQQLIQLEWNGHSRSSEYRTSLEFALDALEEYDVRYWIADLRKMTVILQQDEKWANDNWFPRLFKTRLQKMAIVESNDYFNQTSVERSFTAVKDDLTFKVAYFRNVDMATEWITQEQKAHAEP